MNVNTGTKRFRVALLGNPNTGKSSVFNQLTGLRQKTGNFPGVTVDKKVGALLIHPALEVDLIDFPGTYSFYPNSLDERIVVQTMSNPDDENYPDAIVYVADITKLERHLLLFTQLMDLKLPMILALNMSDIAEREGIELEAEQLKELLQTPVVKVSGRTGLGLNDLKAELEQLLRTPTTSQGFYTFRESEKKLAEQVQAIYPKLNTYQALLTAHHKDWMPHVEAAQKEKIQNLTEAANFEFLRSQVDETMRRFDRFIPIIQKSQKFQARDRDRFTEITDQILTHWLVGPLIFLGLMFLVFQAIFAWATYPMDMIDWIFGSLIETVRTGLPEAWYTDLLTDGILAGIGGVVIFIPQIAILFFLISLLEEVGYMARAAFIFDRVMQFFGLNGRSIVALVSAGACAIPAIMSTRTIGNWKERLITIMVAPLISCSARIPVYTVLIGFVVPSTLVWGVFNMQGLAFMGLYLLGIVAALVVALVFKLILKTEERSFLMLELPEYRTPVMRNVLLTVWEKVKTFILEAGKIIMIISVILWFLASYGMPSKMKAAEEEAIEISQIQNLSEQEAENVMAAKKIEASFAGQLGKAIEPGIKPLGFDWRIGIALITSFAAREVFVGTMATIYSIGSADDEDSVRQQMAKEVDPETGAKVYDLATALSLLMFYVFAMQCMSTLAVVKRETKSWRWPIIQFTFMTALAYLSSLVVYQLFS
ncbi:MAG: ferrous iron transport protein B [Saprospiraceae bacterium]|nr:ferrous iron transport protein B [Saprospiraceae bacterium]